MASRRYTALWNAHWPVGCDPSPPWKPNLTHFRISTNPNSSFNGAHVLSVYDAGNLPYFSGTGGSCKATPGDWNCTSAVAHFGGLPQTTNITAHLEKLEEDIIRQIPDPMFNGVAAIDWEHFKPVFARNTWQHYWIYVNRSIELVRSQHPSWPLEKLTRTAEASFNAAAQHLFTVSIRHAIRLRPHGRWGFYNFAGGSCYGDPQLAWMWDEVTALFPSIYLRSTDPPAKSAAFVDRVLGVAHTVRAAVRAKTGRVLPIYSYTWADYFGTAGHRYGPFLSPADVETEFVRGATKWALDGTVRPALPCHAHLRTHATRAHTHVARTHTRHARAHTHRSRTHTHMSRTHGHAPRHSAQAHSTTSHRARGRLAHCHLLLLFFCTRVAAQVMWGMSAEKLNTTRCGGGPASISAYLNHTLGPAILRAANAADACASSRCSGHGKCWGDTGAGGARGGEQCVCDAGRTRDDCSGTEPSPATEAAAAVAVASATPTPPVASNYSLPFTIFYNKYAAVPWAPNRPA